MLMGSDYGAKLFSLTIVQIACKYCSRDQTVARGPATERLYA